VFGMQEYNFLYIFDIKIIEIYIHKGAKIRQTDRRTHRQTYTHRHTDMKQLNPQYTPSFKLTTNTGLQ